MKRRSLHLAALLVWLALAPAQVAGQGVSDRGAQAAQETADAMHGWLQRLLSIPADLPIDASLRSAIERLVAEHLVRMRPVFRQWAAEEARRLGDDLNQAGDSMRLRMTARYVNEVALSRLEGAGPAYDQAILEAILKPATCRGSERLRYFASIVWLLQNVDPPKRQVVLDGERELFARWGAVRPGLPKRPIPSQAEQELRELALLKAGQAEPLVPMPPVLAAKALDLKKHAVTGGYACVMRRWGLEQALAQPGASRDHALAAYRYATAPLAQEWLENEGTSGTESGDYPRVAALHGVEGVVTVGGSIDAAGRLLEARVIARSITVPGVGGVPPVAFETIFDDASLARVAAERYDKPDPARLRGGAFAFTREIRWRLR